MPRPKKPTPEQANSLVSSAARVTSRRKRNLPKGTGAGWQTEARQMVYDVGELEFYRDWMSNALSRVTLYVVRENPDGTEERVTEGDAWLALQALFGGEQGQSQMMSTFAGLLSIQGESWLVGLLPAAGAPADIDTWRVLSKDEVTIERGKVVIDRGDGEPESYSEGQGEPGDDDYEEPQVYTARIWKPDPFRGVEAHSSVRSALPILRELLGLTKKKAANIDSRLAGAGILFVPTEMTFSSPAPSEDPTATDADSFMAELTETMLTAIRDRGDASSVVPIVVKAPAQYIAAIKHITFWSELNAEDRENLSDCIKRLANSLSVPAEVLLGMGDINHWGQWFTDESGVKMFIEPLLNLITHAVTTRYLWPCLQGVQATLPPEVVAYKIRGDTSELRQRPDRSTDARDLHDRGIITDAALAREAGGFEGDDLLEVGSDEYVRRMLQRLASGTVTPDIVAAALSVLLPSVALPEAVPADQVVDQGPAALPAGPSAPTPPGPPEAPATPPTAAQVHQAWSAAVLLGVEGVVVRAVERAWNKAGRRRGQTAVPPEQMDACLAGAWDRLPRVAAMTGTDPDLLVSTVDTYAREVLATGADYDATELAALLADEVLSRG